MKRFKYIQPVLFTAIVVAVISSCGVKREPGSVYMPDMAYSRAYETYLERDSLMFSLNREDANSKHLIFYNNRPVPGTMRQGEMNPYTLTDDSAGYALSAGVKNPLGPLNAIDSAEAGRLFNINCAVCHGATGKGDGPIYEKIGAVANLTGDQYIKMADGTMFHAMTYGKNNMGSYASQLSRHQRWMIVNYIRTLQPKAAAGAATDTTKGATATIAKADTATAKGTK